MRNTCHTLTRNRPKVKHSKHWKYSTQIIAVEFDLILVEGWEARREGRESRFAFIPLHSTSLLYPPPLLLHLFPSLLVLSSLLDPSTSPTPPISLTITTTPTIQLTLTKLVMIIEGMVVGVVVVVGGGARERKREEGGKGGGDGRRWREGHIENALYYVVLPLSL